MKNVHVLVSGKVQGVFFRANTKEKAEDLGVKGWVKNTSDGKVEAVFEGKDDNVKEMIEWCKHGSTLAKVKNVDVEEKEPENKFNSFSIKY